MLLLGFCGLGVYVCALYLAECYQSMCSLLASGCSVALGERDEKAKEKLVKMKGEENGAHKRERVGWGCC